MARAWFEKWETGVTASTAKSQKERLAKHIIPTLGQCPVEDLRNIDDYRGSPSAASALKFLPLVFCRPGERRNAK